MIWYEILLPFLFLIYVEFEARRDFKKIEEEDAKGVHTLKGKWHKQSAIITFFVILGLCIPLFFDHITTGLAGVFLLCNLFWIGLDLRLNMFRDKPLLYIGHTAEIDKYYRRTFPGPERAMLATKLFLLIIFIPLYFL